MKLNEVKEFVALKHGCKSGILGTAWDFANYLYKRKKEQIEMYDDVISILNTKVLEYEEKLRWIPIEEEDAPNDLVLMKLSNGEIRLGNFLSKMQTSSGIFVNVTHFRHLFL